MSKIFLFIKKLPKLMIKELPISLRKLLDKKLLMIWQRKLSTFFDDVVMILSSRILFKNSTLSIKIELL